MKKNILLSVLFISIFAVNSAQAVLTNNTPTKYTNVKNTTYSKSAKQATTSITQAQKQKYYNDYVKYLEQTIMSLGCFNSTDTYNANISINLSFNSDYSVQDASVNVHELGTGREIINNGINRDVYQKKCNLCESKLFITKFKPFDMRYADGEHSTKEFFITLKNMELQKTIAAYQISKTIVDYNYWTPTSTTSNAIVKVTLRFGKERFWMKSYSIIDSSGDNDYNSMIDVALKRWINRISGNVCCDDYNHYIGDVTIFFKFNGNKVDQYNNSQNGTSEIDNYKSYVSNKINMTWKMVNDWNSPISAIVKFSIAENGRLNYVAIEQSSGQWWFDEQVKSAVYAASPFEHLPKSIQDGCLQMTHSFMYNP